MIYTNSNLLNFLFLQGVDKIIGLSSLKHLNEHYYLFLHFLIFYLESLQFFVTL